MIFVPDASAVLGALFPDEHRPGSNVILDLLEGAEPVAPTIWPAEVANGLLKGFRRGRLDEAQLLSGLDALSKISVELVEFDGREINEHVMPLAHAHRLTVYDALYLRLACFRRAPLASGDGALRRAAKGEGVKLL